MAEFLSFAEISQAIKFVDFLNWLNIPFEEENGEVKTKLLGKKVIISKDKNLFFSPESEELKGSTINFLAFKDDISLRDAALKIKKQFLVKDPEKEIPHLDLFYCPYLEAIGIKKETAQKLEFGMVKQKSIMAGRIAFRIYDHDGNKVVGYMGFHPEKLDWLVPKNFRQDYVFNVHRVVVNNEPVILTTDLYQCAKFVQAGERSVSLTAGYLTDEQARALSFYPYILVHHSHPDNIITRLSKSSFVKVYQK